MSGRFVPLGAGPVIPLGGALIVVGRHPDCDVRLPSFLVSRRHCCLTEVDREVLVRDLGSSNGTRINGRRVESGRLRRGDELAIADLRYRLEGGGDSAVCSCGPPALSKGDGCPTAGLEGTKLPDES